MALTTKLNIDFIDHNQERLFLERIETLKRGETRRKYRLIFLIMIDCGTRISETVTIRLHQILSAKRMLRIETLKKRGDKKEVRDIPMTPRVMEALAEHYKYLTDRTQTAYLFPSKEGLQDHISRKTVWKVIKRLSNEKVHPHLLRHTCLTRLASKGADMHTIKAIAGHSSVRMTEQYIHASEFAKTAAIQQLDRSTWYQKLYRKIVPVKTISVLPAYGERTQYHVGRVKEIASLIDLTEKKVNVYLQGPKGIGKTHILDNLEASETGKILRIDDLKSMKKSLQTILMYLVQGDKEALAALMFKDKSKIDQIVTKDSVKRLCEHLISLTKRHEYTLLIDDATRITPAGVEVLEKLNYHFHMIVAARNIKINAGTFLSNFQKVELKELSRSETLELIRMDTDFTDRVQDYEQYKNHIWNTTNGNPLYTLEMIERYRKEKWIGNDLISGIRHNSAMSEIDMTIPLLIGISGLMILRYVGGEFDDDTGAYKLFGGGFMVFALFARGFFNLGKRTYV